MAKAINTEGKILKMFCPGARGSAVLFAAQPIRILVLAIVLALTAVGCASTNTVSSGKITPDFVRPDFNERRTNILRVLVMPARVDIDRLTFWREKKGSAREVAVASQKLQGVVEARLRALGFTVQAGSTNESAEVVEARKRLHEWIGGLTWGSPEQGLGETAKILADDGQADALVCVEFLRTKTTWQRRLRGYHTTAASWVGAAAGAGGVLAGVYFSHAEGIGGEGIAGLVILGGAGGFILFKKASWLLTGGADDPDATLPNRAVLHVALVDGATGEVLWSNSATVESGAKDPQRMVADVFENFPR